MHLSYCRVVVSSDVISCELQRFYVNIEEIRPVNYGRQSAAQRILQVLMNEMKAEESHADPVTADMAS